MRRSERMMAAKESERFLAQAQVGRLGTSRNNKPYVTPLNFVYEKGSVYFHCAREGKKLTNMAENKRVCFEADEFFGVKQVSEGAAACTSSTYYRSVIAFGKAQIVKSNERRRRILEKLVAKYRQTRQSSTRPILDNEKLANTTIIKIRISQITGKQNLPDKLKT